jgi:hypothetical protein
LPVSALDARAGVTGGSDGCCMTPTLSMRGKSFCEGWRVRQCCIPR